MSSPAPTAVVVPIRSFDATKSRLSAVLSPSERRLLSMAMAGRVVAASGHLPAWVVSDDPEVAEWATARGAAVVAPATQGLNPSVQAAVAQLEGDGIGRVIVAHADLPEVIDLTGFVQPGVVIAPDANRDGSNVMSVPTGLGFTFAYGPGSFSRHRDEARRLGLHCSIVEEPGLGWDVDEPEDLPVDWRTLLHDDAAEDG